MLTTYKARVPKRVVLLLFLLSEIAERVNDHTENKIQRDDDDEEEEEQIVDEANGVQGLRAARLSQDIAYAASVAQAVVQCCHNAHEQCVTRALQAIAFHLLILSAAGERRIISKFFRQLQRRQN